MTKECAGMIDLEDPIRSKTPVRATVRAILVEGIAGMFDAPTPNVFGNMLDDAARSAVREQHHCRQSTLTGAVR